MIGFNPQLLLFSEEVSWVWKDQPAITATSVRTIAELHLHSDLLAIPYARSLVIGGSETNVDEGRGIVDHRNASPRYVQQDQAVSQLFFLPGPFLHVVRKILYSPRLRLMTNRIGAAKSLKSFVKGPFSRFLNWFVKQERQKWNSSQPKLLSPCSVSRRAIKRYEKRRRIAYPDRAI